MVAYGSVRAIRGAFDALFSLYYVVVAFAIRQNILLKNNPRLPAIKLLRFEPYVLFCP